MADIPIPPIPPRRAPLIDIMRELEARPRARQSQEFDPVAALAAERRSQSRQPLPLPPIPPAVAPPRTAGDSAEAGPPLDLSAVAPTIRSRLPEGNPYVAAAIDIAEKYNLPRDVFLSLVHQESKFDPKAKSPRGAFGLAQLMPGTARELGVDPRDPMANLDAGARYLRQQIDRFGSLPLALAAYNAGPQRVIDAGRVVPNIRETQDYVHKIMRNAGMEGYGYAEGGLAELDEKYAEGGRIRRPAAAPVASPFDADYIERLAAQAVGAGDPVTEVRSSEGRGFAPMPRDASEALQRMAAVVRGDVEPTPEEERQISHVRGFTEGPASIRAYHGSPHRFERFDISKIGTGEGSQAYGHGLYFAEAEPVAFSYRGNPEARYARLSGHMSPREEFAFDMAVKPNIRDWDIIESLIKRYGDTISFDEANQLAKNAISNRGHMYEVRLNTMPEELVNWNAPLVQQPERAIPFLDDILKAPRTGSARILERQMKPIGEAVDLRTPEVAMQLREVGIPGLRYLDANSRTRGGGTRNYVMFGDDLIDITRRYAEGGLAELDQKYAEGGMVREPATAYDPDEIDRIVQEFAEGGEVNRDLMGQPFSNDYSRYSYAERPEIDWAGGKRPLNVQNLYDLGAFRFAHWNGDPSTLSLVSYFNDSSPDSVTTNWPTVSRERAQEALSSFTENPWPLYTGKYNQIVDSARRLGISDEDIFLPQNTSTAEGFAEGGEVEAPAETTINGQEHKLAYITDREAALLKARGGSGRMTKHGIRAYDEGPGEGPGSDNANSMSEAATQDAVGGNQGQGAGPTGAGAGAGPPGPPDSNPNQSMSSEDPENTQAAANMNTAVAAQQAGRGMGIADTGGVAPTGFNAAPGIAEALGALGRGEIGFGQALGYGVQSAMSPPGMQVGVNVDELGNQTPAVSVSALGVVGGLMGLATGIPGAGAIGGMIGNEIGKELGLDPTVMSYEPGVFNAPEPTPAYGAAGYGMDYGRGYAHGGLAKLHAKYAGGGSVSAYDPRAVDQLAKQIEAQYV